MATIYSDLYGAPPGSEAGAVEIYRGPHGPMSKGGVYIVEGTVTLAEAFGADADARLLKAVAGTRLLRITIVPSADLDAAGTFTFNLGWADASNTHASASTGLQGATALQLGPDTLLASDVAPSHGDLVLTRVAGSLDIGSLAFIAELAS